MGLIIMKPFYEFNHNDYNNVLIDLILGQEWDNSVELLFFFTLNIATPCYCSQLQHTTLMLHIQVIQYTYIIARTLLIILSSASSKL